ncbi:MAG: RsmD family RNA methyltransferase [Puniceicoccales bacterium]|nr:RsmD family RNA methyltransferase [Puniceicoccales bacterium]
MRISGGRARGISLISLSRRELRPATGSLREALFSSLGAWIRDKSFLDLFAGTGSYGLEALSRGARAGVFVERNRRMAEILRQNLQAVLKSLKISSSPCEVRCGDVWHFRSEQPFNLIFLDPPFVLSRSQAPSLLAHVLPLLQSGGRLAFELPSDLAPPAHESLSLLRRLGQTTGQGPSMAVYEKGEGSDHPHKRDLPH